MTSAEAMSPADIPVYPGPQVRAWMGTIWALAIITTFVVGLRVYVTTRVTRQGTWALVWTLLAWIGCMTSTALSTHSAVQGLGQHLVVVEAHGTVDSMLQTAFAAIFVFDYAIGFGKAAVVAFLLTIQGPVARDRYFLYFIAASNLVMALPISFIEIFQCSPPRALWSVELQAMGAVCHRQSFYLSGYWWGSWNALSDFLLAVYPMFFIFPLNISKRLKFIYATLLGLGIFAAVCSCIRTYYLWKFAHSEDQSYDAALLFLFAQLEEWLVVLLASIPAVWPLFKDRLISRVCRSATGRNHYFNYTGSHSLSQTTSNIPNHTITSPNDQPLSPMYPARRFSLKPQAAVVRRADSERNELVIPHTNASGDMASQRSGETGGVGGWDEEEGGIVMRRDVEVTQSAWEPRDSEGEVGIRESYKGFEDDLARFGLADKWEAEFREREMSGSSNSTDKRG